MGERDQGDGREWEPDGFRSGRLGKDPGDPYAGRRRGTLHLRLCRQHHRHHGCERKHYYLPLQQLRAGMGDPGSGRTQRVFLLRRRRPSGDARRPQREYGAYPLQHGSLTYQLHHVTPINQGGMVYDIGNIVIVTPRYHAEMLLPSYHGYNGFNKFFK